jgi:uncharacterized protein (TIGR03437 family)
MAAQRNRITAPIRNTDRVRLAGHLPGQAKPENDDGPVDPSMPLHSLSLVLKPSAAQQADLDQLLAGQQDSSSPDYHRWLTPEEFADRFGVSPDDLRKIADWLGQQNLTVTGTGRARNWVSFSGTAQQVQDAFGLEIHRFRTNGEAHFSNVTEPSLPAALDVVVRGIHGLNDFRMQPRHIRKPSPESMSANYTSGKGSHYLAPDDIAAVYNIKPLYDAGINGTGQKIVVVGQTQIDVADIQQFRTYFNLPASDPQVILVPGTRDPGISTDDLAEADLDIQWAGAVARNAAIVYVYSNDVTDAVQYAIDQNLAPVLTMSYGFCEAQASTSDAQTLRSWAKQANAQGMTWFAASGDSGGADCVGGNSRAGGLAVDLPAAIPEVTGVGGTEFNEGSGNYWNAANTANNASILSYIPETAWNDSAADGTPSAGGGGASVLFAKPTWQTGAGVPADGARDVPDVALAASADHDGYLIFTGGKLSVVGGTSVAAPAFAGLAALINHRLVSTGAQSTPGLGNVNPGLYALAKTTPAAFHDVITGDNLVTVTCGTRLRNCTPGTFGYSSGAGYDQATGLGSVDAYQLALAWNPAVLAAAAGPPSIAAVTNGASFRQTFAPGMILTVFGSQLAPSVASAASVPLPAQLAGVSATVNGVAAPLYFVAPGQMNLQVPYEAGSSGQAVLTIANNGQTASTTFAISPLAPAIFADANGSVVPSAAAVRNQFVTLYITGAGAVSPSIATGAAPLFSTALANLPKPQPLPTVTVGGVQCFVQFAGIPWGLVGVIQINIQIPANAPLGLQPVIVSIGNTASPAATVTVSGQ